MANHKKRKRRIGNGETREGIALHGVVGRHNACLSSHAEYSFIDPKGLT